MDSTPDVRYFWLSSVQKPCCRAIAHYLDALMAEKRADYERGMKRRKLDPDLSDREYLRWWSQELGVQ